jgi:prefoldin subunit 5
MRTLTIALLLLVGLPAWAQDAAPIDEPPRTEAVEEPADDGALLRAVDLREKVRGMRRSVLGGGPAVERAEREALVFYRKKIQEIASRIDELRTDRDAKDAEYRLALDFTLEAKSPTKGEAAARHAARLKAEIAGIDAEIAELIQQRDQLSAASAAISARIDRRKRVLTHFDTDPEVLQPLPFLGEDVIGPDEEELAASDPFADGEFLSDLMRRDPDQARRILFERDPTRYWRMFPLTPPENVLRKVFPYPRPGNR